MGSDDPYQQAFVAGRLAWPDVQVDERDFAAHLARLAVNATAAAAHGADLFLAFACARGDGRALLIFESSFLGRAAEYVARFRRDEAFQQEVQQIVREKLLAGTEAKMATYVGAGPLQAWVRMIIVRVALDLTNDDARWESLETRLAGDILAANDSVEERLVKERYRPIVDRALRAAMQDLSARDLGLLRIYFVDGFSIDRIAAIHKVHRGTAARWIIALRDRLFDQVRGAVGLHTGLSPSEVESVSRLLRSELHVSLSKVLEPGGERSGG